MVGAVGMAECVVGWGLSLGRSPVVGQQLCNREFLWIGMVSNVDVTVWMGDAGVR